MPEIPRDHHFGKTLAFLGDPYRYISKRCHALNSDLFQTRVFFHSGICITGPAMAELFYDETRFKRRGVAPRRFQKTLFGQGGVQGMDGPAHQHRKRMFMSLMTPEQINRIGTLSAEQWAAYADKWSNSDQIVLYDETCELLTKVACAWAEVPLDDAEIAARTRELTAMFDYAGSIGPKHWWARISRKRAEQWIIGVVQKVRSRELVASEDSAAYIVAMHRDLAGELLSPEVAAVELLNVLRPIVAVSVYLTFAALSLHNYPACRQQLQAGADDYPHWFAQEVRRFYPFFPAVGAEVRHDFEWNGYRFLKGMPVLLDLYGTNHDARTWAHPQQFQPERFRSWDGNLYNFIPHGGGDHYVNHRCPGEWIAIELLKVASTFLAKNINYDLPEQELTIDFARVPALPQSKFVIRNVRAVAG